MDDFESLPPHSLSEYMNDKILQAIREHFETNLTGSAKVRDDERDCAKRKAPPSNLAEIPRDQWDNHIYRQIALPPAVAAYLDGRPVEPYTTEEIDNLEEAIEKALNVTAPYFILMDHTMREGRPWQFISDAAPYLTGFTLCKEETFKELDKRLRGLK